MNENTQYFNSLLTGDRKILEKIYTDLAPKFKAYVLKNGGKAEDARDAFQEGITIVLIKQRKNEIKDKSNFKGFLFGVCRNIWLNKINRSREIFERDLVLQYRGPTEETCLQDEEGNLAWMDADTALAIGKFQLFEEGLSQLSQRCRDMIALSLKKLSYEAIKEKLGYNTTGRVGKKLHVCKDQLNKFIRSHPNYHNLYSL